MSLNVLYRISDSSFDKIKMGFATKLFCLNNFCVEFSSSNIIIVADNCKIDTIKKLEIFDKKIIQTALGNTNSWRFCVNYALENFGEEDCVYFVEDDYLHLPGSESLILEGLEIADYVTLYDHPEMYKNPEAGGGNPFIKYGGEETRVLLSPSSHWKFTNSTTMTFAVKVKTIKSDKSIWWEWTTGVYPNDFYCFIHLCSAGSMCKRLKVMGIRHILRNLLLLRFRFLINFCIGKNRKLINSLPGRSTHVEEAFLSPLINWNIVN